MTDCRCQVTKDKGHVIPRLRLLAIADRTLAALLATIVLGACLAFGGAVWWARPALAVLTAALMAAGLARALFQGSWRLLKSPLTLLGGLALLLAVAQLAPLPARWAELVAPRSRAIHALGGRRGPRRAGDPPGASALRAVGPAATWAVEVPDRPFLIGSLPGGPGAYLALAALGLPLTLGLALHVLAPRGSRERAWARLPGSGGAGLLALLIGL